MVRMTFKTANDLKNLLALVSCVNDEVPFHFNPDGFLIRVMDPSKIAMVNLIVNKAFFEEFDLKGQQNPTMTISLSQLEKLVRGMSKNPVTLEITPTEALTQNKLYIEQLKPYHRKFNMPILEPSEGEIPPELQIVYRNTIKMTVGCLRQLIEDAKLVGDHITFQTTSDALIAQTQGSLLTYNASIQQPNEDLLNMEIGEPDAKAVFTLKYLDDITKAAAKIAQIVTLKISKDKPIHLTFETPPETQLWYALAPTIEPE